MEFGDLVELFIYSPHDAELSKTPMHIGIYMGEVYNDIDGGWYVWTGEQIKSFNRRWWKCREIKNENN